MSPIVPLVTAAVLAAAAATAPAATYVLPAEGAVVGQLAEEPARAEDTLLDIARRHNLGYEEIKLANPDVDPWLPGPGTRIVLPTQFVLPDGPRRGIVLNLAEMRIYYYRPARRGEPATVTTHPVSIGRMDWATPLGTTRVVAKAKNPAWYPPESIRAEHAAEGDPLPRVVPPGPENPLGDYALRLGLPGYLIHGTNKPYGIGMRVSHGCVRMYPEDIERLFGEVRVGTPVRIVNQPVKAGWRDGVLYVEVHPSTGVQLPEGSPDPTESVRRIVAVTPSDRAAGVSWSRVNLALTRYDGVPIPVSEDGLALTLSSDIDPLRPYLSRRVDAAAAPAPSPAGPVLRASRELSRDPSE